MPEPGEVDAQAGHHVHGREHVGAVGVTLLPQLPDRLQPLMRLAYNVWWSWSHDAIALFRRIDADAWERVEHSPVKCEESCDSAQRGDALAFAVDGASRFAHQEARGGR